jgi:hypothetical protein
MLLETCKEEIRRNTIRNYIFREEFVNRFKRGLIGGGRE